jgi:glutathione S-transferase
MALELVGFPLCPFVQRALIVLKEKNLACAVTWLDPDAPPDWLGQVSPLGQLPVLRVSGLADLYDSQAICEYLEDISSPPMHPVGPLMRAQDRSWIALASHLLVVQQRLAAARDEADFQQARAALARGLERVAAAWIGGPFWRGSRFCLVDAAFAPLLLRLEVLSAVRPELAALLVGALPAWAAALRTRPAVQQATIPEFADCYRDLLRRQGAFVLAPAPASLA